MAFLVGISTENKTWCNTWSGIPFGVTARVVDDATLLPQREQIVRFELPAGSGSWMENDASTIELMTNYNGEVSAEIKIATTAPQKLAITASVVKDDGTLGATYTSTVVIVAPTVKAPDYPIASGDQNKITEDDVAAGVYAILVIDNPNVADLVTFHFGVNPLIRHSENNTTENILPIAVPDEYMTTGAHDTGYYIVDSAGNPQFSHVTTVNVQRDSTSSTIVDLPAFEIANAENDIINIASATLGVVITLNGDYNGEIVNVAAKENTYCNIYWKSYIGKEEVPAASTVFTFLVDAEGRLNPVVLDDTYDGGTDALRDLFYALGEGILKISYEMVMEIDNKLHASKEQTYYVDVVPPGRK
ncbi:hypothetical protein [Cedecea sp.]|jgi:hypothetical protein|uniref:hypothetical protein n=1 Tax=Cedecea sp. TaxID=1970739 RepID=UPI0012ADE5B7|nr:hypothetical protein [Enterobacteriaceae bacterium RIT693]